MAQGSRRAGWWVAALAVAAMIGVVAVRLGFPGRGRVGGAPRLDADAAREIVTKTNVALGLLENQALDECLPRFEEVRAAVPGDPLPWRNLAVARVVALGDGGAEPAAEALAAARDAIAGMERVEGAGPESLWLSARAAQAGRDAAAWAAATERLEKLAPDDAAVLYERWRSLREGSADAAATLERACRADPRNLWLVIEWCRATALSLGERPPPPLPDGLAATLESRWEAMAPFASSIRTFANVDLRDLLDKAITAAGTGDAAGVAGRLRGLANVLVPQSEADRRAIERHPLEFVRERFLPGFYEATGLAAADAVPPIPVTFADGPAPPPFPGPVAAVVVEDFDLDGAADLILLGGGRVAVFGRGGDGFRELAAAEVPAGARGVVAVDLDLDFDEAKRSGTPVRPGTDPAEVAAAKVAAGCPAADLDLVVHGDGGVFLLENLAAEGGARTLRPIEVPAMADLGAVHAVAAADLDADGNLDLVTGGDGGIRVWRNLGGARFEPLGGAFGGDAPVRALVAVDWDRDVDVDIMAGGDAGVAWLENLLHGQFRHARIGDEAGSPRPVAAIEVLDADADGAWDLLAGGPAGVVLVRSTRGATGVVRTSAPRTLSDAPTTGLSALDFDNDGVLDLARRGPAGLTLARGLAEGAFAAEEPVVAGAVAGVDAADVDRDGDLDLAIAGDAGPLLRENRGGNAHHWIDVALEAQQIKGSGVSPSGRVNAHGLGSLLELKAGPRYQPRAVRRRTTHFGLGPRAEADVVRVAWINGVPQNVIRPPADTLVCEEQILLGSCPYLYVWDGERFVFATDLLWGSPLGLQRSRGELMPARAREWLKIDRPMAARDGRYELRVTEELWEAAYFDTLRLHVVDHPADVAIHTNEKVGPAAIAGFKIHTVRRPIAPRAARDGEGRDVSAAIAAPDGVFAPTIRTKLRQGLVDRNVLELDFGAIPDAASAVLYLTGWTYPTTVGQNVGLTADPLGIPRPPWLSVPDGAGGWREAIPFTGFPGGKTKTVAIDVSGVLDPHAAILRVETTMEIRWDAAFLASGEEPAPVTVTAVDVERATLGFRGRSRIEQDDGDGPERFVYDEVLVAPRWPPMRGAFTAYGEVGDLVAEEDDLLVVMGAGDEMAVAFPVPPGPPEGWTRDFLLESVGWDKDANLATAEGQTVEPLPFRAMRSYPPAEGDLPAPSERRDEWLRRRQTRHQDESYWRVIRRWDGDGGSLGGGRSGERFPEGGDTGTARSGR